MKIREDMLQIEFFKLKPGQQIGRFTEAPTIAPPFEDEKNMIKWCKSALANRHVKENQDWPDGIRVIQYGKEIHRWTETDRLIEINNRRYIKMELVDKLIEDVRNLRDRIKEQLDGIEEGKYMLKPSPPLSAEQLKDAMEATVEDLSHTLKRYGRE